MRITKKSKSVNACTSVLDPCCDAKRQAVRYIKQAMETLAESTNQDGVISDSIANLSVVMLDLQDDECVQE